MYRRTAVILAVGLTALGAWVLVTYFGWLEEESIAEQLERQARELEEEHGV